MVRSAVYTLFVIAGASSTWAATTYYVSPSGDDTNPGTDPTAPWRSAARASQMTYTSGDAILFQGGVTHNESEGGAGLTVRTVGGFASPPVLVASYGSGVAELLGSGMRFDGITILNTGGVEVCNISVVDGALAGDLHTISHAGVHALSTGANNSAPRFESIYIHDVSTRGFLYGVAVDAFSSCQGFAGVRIERVSATNATGTGISSQGSYSSTCYSHSDVVVADSEAAWNQGDAANTQSWSGSGIVLSGVDGAVISRCDAHHNGGSNGHKGGGPCGIWGWMVNNLTISHCSSHENSNGQAPLTSNDGCGFDLDGGATNSAVEYSLSFWNSGPGFLVCDFGAPIVTRGNAIRFSVSLDDGLASLNGATGVNWWTPSVLANTTVVGSTLVSSRAVPVVAPLESGSGAYPGVTLLRNALLALGGEGGGTGPTVSFAPPPPGARLSGNQYWAPGAPASLIAWGGASYATLAAFRAGTGQETGPGGAPTGSDADPGLSTGGGFFESCVDWQPGYPAIPNSAALDTLRGFSGCG